MATPARLLETGRTLPGTSPLRDVPAPVREHYLIERELAARLREASRGERRTLYTELYNELYRRFPSHPQLVNKVTPETKARRVSSQMALLGRFLRKDKTFMEIGAGDCSLSFHVAQRVKFVYAVDVSDEITRTAVTPHNFRLRISDGSSIPLLPNSVDVAYSNQLMEHLHPDDALEQLQNVRNALAPGGVYICITPSRLTGPHDVSKHFDDEATGFHLKEYTTTELARMFKRVGFRKVRAAIGGRDTYIWIPAWLLAPIESVLIALPPQTRRRAARSAAFRWLLGVRLLGRK